MKQYDLIGVRFGKLVVVEKVKIEGKTGVYWKCKCDCGNECVAITNKLTSGRKTKCDNNITRKKIDNIIGQKFGKLTVISKDQIVKGMPIKWVCQCECGNPHKAYGSHLTNGLVKSCGCVRRESKVKYEFFETYIVGRTLNDDIFEIDIDDYNVVCGFNWFIDKDGYLVATRNNKRIIMSHLIMNPNKNEVVDHIDHNVSNNRKNNLRICTLSQNAMNRKRHSNNTSGKKGVSYHKGTGKWRSYITLEGKTTHLGSYELLDDAIAARIKAEEVYHGDYKYSG